MADPQGNMSKPNSKFYTGAEAVDISGGNETFTNPPMAGLFVGTSGDIKVDTPESTAITFSNVPAGFFPVAVTQVYQTGTTAADMVGVW